MVRFKNRYLIVEFLQPSTSTPQLEPAQRINVAQINAEDFSDDDEDREEDDDTLARIPEIPFLLPPIPDLNRLRDGEDAGKGLYKAVRGMVQDVFGDEGWGRISSSFRVIYHSPLTSMTLVRIARPHIRTLHAALTLISTIDGKAVLPRVLGVSGTVKKAQGRIMVYHRAVIARILARFDEGMTISSNRERSEVEKRAEAERATLAAMDD